VITVREVTMRQCPDCRVELVPISVNTSGSNYLSRFPFVVGDRKPRNFTFFGLLKNDIGQLGAFLCPECGRVLWYAEKK